MDKESDELRGEFLGKCEALIEHTRKARSYAMEPGKAWLTRSELAKMSQVMSELEELLAQLKSLESKS